MKKTPGSKTNPCSSWWHQECVYKSVVLWVKEEFKCVSQVMYWIYLLSLRLPDLFSVEATRIAHFYKSFRIVAINNLSLRVRCSVSSLDLKNNKLLVQLIIINESCIIYASASSLELISFKKDLRQSRELEIQHMVKRSPGVSSRQWGGFQQQFWGIQVRFRKTRRTRRRCTAVDMCLLLSAHFLLLYFISSHFGTLFSPVLLQVNL